MPDTPHVQEAALQVQTHDSRGKSIIQLHDDLWKMIQTLEDMGHEGLCEIDGTGLENKLCPSLTFVIHHPKENVGDFEFRFDFGGYCEMSAKYSSQPLNWDKGIEGILGTIKLITGITNVYQKHYTITLTQPKPETAP